MLNQTSGSQENYLPKTPELKTVQKIIEKKLASRVPHLQLQLERVKKSRGKMLRPLLVLLFSSLQQERIGDKLSVTDRLKTPDCTLTHRNPKNEPPTELAAGVELIHLASLIHDDIIDEGTTRRGQPALQILVGKQKATKAGDFLMAAAFALISTYYRLGIPHLLSKTTGLMCEGEVEQLNRAGDCHLDREEYYLINYKKTASFLEACCLAGLKSSGVNQPVYLEAAKIYGKNLGYAFQILDDILDFTASPQETGKTSNADLNQGIITLPLIYLVQKTGCSNKVSSLLANSSCPEARNQLMKLIIENHAVEEAAREAVFVCRKAGKALDCFPGSRTRENLREIINGLEKKAFSYLNV